VYKESFDRLRVLKPEIEHIRKVRYCLSLPLCPVTAFYTFFTATRRNGPVCISSPPFRVIGARI
jgi:hypothetical protein